MFNRPATEFVARFMGGHNVLATGQGKVAVRNDRMAITPISSAAPSTPHLPATVTDIEYQGSYVLLGLAVDNTASQQVNVSLPEATFLQAPLDHGTAVHLAWREADAHPLPA